MRSMFPQHVPQEEVCRAHKLLLQKVHQHCWRYQKPLASPSDTMGPVAPLRSQRCVCRQCGEGGCEEVTGGEGIQDADMAVYVTARRTPECGPSTTAHAVACVRDDDNWCASRPSSPTGTLSCMYIHAIWATRSQQCKASTRQESAGLWLWNWLRWCAQCRSTLVAPLHACSSRCIRLSKSGVTSAVQNVSQRWIPMLPVTRLEKGDRHHIVV